ncbi:MAG TPA: gliding motility-associated C-terminal domain-containing protein, partial [Chitinophagales bacterium]|nr:gliding motility-associated C-terminal domain-containing protein [Chitinophagales bacterium]
TIDEFTIYNRWGQVMFDIGNVQVASQNSQPLDLTYSWDGIFKGEKQPVGVYVYYLKGKGTAPGAASIERKGNFTLVR